LPIPVPTARLGLVVALSSLVVLVLPVATGWGLVVVNGILLAVALADASAAPAPGAVAVERDLPGALTLGVSGAVVWRAGNPAGRRTTVSLADELAPSLRPERRRVRLRLPPRGTVTARTSITPTRRGRFTPTAVTVRTEGPLGLGARQATRSIPGLLRVLPPFRSRQEAELRIRRARLLDVGVRSAQGRGGGTDFDNLREYTVDDEFRRMDWAATARSGKAIVRTYRAERNQTVLVLLDCSRVMAGRIDGVPRLEHAMDAALMMTAVATGLGDRAGLVAFDREVRAVVPPSHAAGQMGRVMDAMYALEPRLVESDYRGAFSETLARYRRRAMLVVLTELTEEAVGQTLVPALPLLSRRHLVVVASLTDPDVARWADDVPTEAVTSYRKAAATVALERRSVTAALLRAAGAVVVDAPPGKLAGRLADAYLDVKTNGRL
jgi:uncharacterized protein (DUF58 family)